MRHLIVILALAVAVALLASCSNSSDTSGSSADGASTSGGTQNECIVCGNTTCDVACCPDGNQSTCTEDATSCALAMRCDGPEDCGPGEVCCIGPGACQDCGGVSCVAAGSCEGTDQIACHSGEDCPNSTACGPAKDALSFVATLLGCK